MEGITTGRQKMVQGKLNAPPTAKVSKELEMRGQEWIRQFSTGFPVAGNPAGPVLFPTNKCADP